MSPKTCTQCRVVKPLTEFASQAHRKGGVHPWCRDCDRKYQRDRHRKNPERRWAANLLKRYGLTQQDYDSMLEEQAGKCAVCGDGNGQIQKSTGRTRRLHVDHDHRTGKIRALLCSKCNAALGSANDDPRRLRDLAEYLECF